MQIHLIAIGKNMPAWIGQGFEEYAKRLNTIMPLHLHAISSPRKSKSQDRKSIMREEGKKLLGAIPDSSWVVALDEDGQQWGSKKLAEQINKWSQHSNQVSLLVGGTDGLDQSCLERADQIWSLSALTLPHALVRVVVAEQLYRAWSLNNNHPYHRS